MELLLSGEVLVLDALVGLMDKVLQLWKEVNQHGTLIIYGFIDVPKGLVEEVENWKQGKE